MIYDFRFMIYLFNVLLVTRGADKTYTQARGFRRAPVHHHRRIAGVNAKIDFPRLYHIIRVCGRCPIMSISVQVLHGFPVPPSANRQADCAGIFHRLPLVGGVCVGGEIRSERREAQGRGLLPSIRQEDIRGSEDFNLMGTRRARRRAISVYSAQSHKP